MDNNTKVHSLEENQSSDFSAIEASTRKSVSSNSYEPDIFLMIPMVQDNNQSVPFPQIDRTVVQM